MSEGPAEPVKAQGKARKATWLIGLAVVVLAGLLYAIASHGFKFGPPTLKSLSVGAMAKLQVPDAPRGQPVAAFLGPKGETLHLADFKGQVLVVNFWATWCAPCVQEMPTLAKLQAAFADKPVKVLAISLDRPEDRGFAQRFILKHGPLVFYQDDKYVLPFALDPRADSVPITVIYDRDGRERARLEGGADWNSPEAKAVLNTVLQIRS